MKWLSALATLALAVTLSAGTSGCKRGEQQTGKGEGGKELTLTAPGNTSITQGEETKVTVKVNRKGFNDPITVTFSDLPKGVKAADGDMTIPKDKDSADFTLKADADAPEVTDHTVTVQAKGGGAEPKGTFKLTVKKK